MQKQKLSEFVAQFLVEQGLQHVFMLTGGGAMHLNDSFGRHPGLEKVYNHHEQASAMAADSYARIRNPDCQCHNRTWWDQYSKRRIWCLGRLFANVGGIRASKI